MWGCEIGDGWQMSRSMFSPGMFFMFATILAIIAAAALALMIRKKNGHGRAISMQDRDDSLEILRIRYAKGELSKDGFFKAKGILYGP